jgi:hypothetical protein
MEDFYARAVPYTVPPRLTQYIDKHLESRVVSMVTAKLTTLLDHQTKASIQQQIDQLVQQQKMQQYNANQHQHNIVALNQITTLMEMNLKTISAATTTSMHLLDSKKDLIIQTLEIIRTTTSTSSKPGNQMPLKTSQRHWKQHLRQWRTTRKELNKTSKMLLN